jgi:hypothetical protein
MVNLSFSAHYSQRGRDCATHGRDDNALERAQRIPQPRARPALQRRRVAHNAALDGCFEAPRMAVAADGDGGVTELEEGEVH